MSREIRIEGHDRVQVLLEVVGDSGPFALSYAINLTGRAAQREMRAQIDRRFQLRGTKKQFQKAIVLRQGNKHRPAAVLGVGSNMVASPTSATAKLGGILARHEEAESPVSGLIYRNPVGNRFTAEGFALPAPGMRTPTRNPPSKYYPRNLGFLQRRLPSGDYGYANPVKRKGRKRDGRIGRRSYFIKPGVGIFERRKGALGWIPRPLWFFSKQIRRPARLGLWETAEEVVRQDFDSYVEEAVAHVLARRLMSAGPGGRVRGFVR
jgi:hypothetical protein